MLGSCKVGLSPSTTTPLFRTQQWTYLTLTAFKPANIPTSQHLNNLCRADGRNEQHTGDDEGNHQDAHALGGDHGFFHAKAHCFGR